MSSQISKWPVLFYDIKNKKHIIIEGLRKMYRNKDKYYFLVWSVIPFSSNKQECSPAVIKHA